MSGWHDFERMRGELEQARDTRLDVVEDSAVDAALEQLAGLQRLVNGDRAWPPADFFTWQASRERTVGYEPRRSAPGRARRWRR